MQSANTKEERRVVWTCAGVVALAVVLASQPVIAQNRLIFFGDSLTDKGRLYEATGGSLPPSPENYLGRYYYQGRFSNGRTYAEHLPELLGVDDVANLAVAGAESGYTNLYHRSANIAALFNLLNVDALHQVDQAVSQGAVGPNTLAVYFIGGNDYQNRARSTNPQTLVTTVIGNINTGISTLARAGQKNFVVLNLPNMGYTPASRLTPAGRLIPDPNDFFGRLASDHNAALAQAVDGLETGLGVDITLVALDDLFDDILVNPGLYGLSDTTKPCFFDPGQTPPPGTARDCSTPEATNSGLFYDDIHPTAYVHRITAEYVAAYLGMKADAGADVASRSMLATLSLRSQQRLVQSRLLSMRFGRTMGREAQEEKMGDHTLYLVGDYGSGDRDGKSNRRGFDYAVKTGMLGMDWRLGQLVAAGAAVGYSNADQSLDRGRGDADLESYFATVYGTFGSGGGGPYADVGLGYSADDFDFSRPTYFWPRPTASADVDGYTWFGLLNGGYDFKVGNTVFGPMIGGRISQSRIDPYTEDAGPMAISVRKTTIDSVVGYVGGQVTSRFESGEVWIVPNVRVTVEKDFAEEQKVTGTLGSGQIISGDAGDDETAVLVGGGLEFGASDQLTAQLTGEATLGRGDGKDYGIQGRLIFSF